MVAAVINTLGYWLNPMRLTGPILDKELRVTSRRKRSYLFRFIYIILLLLFVTVVWLANSNRYDSSQALSIAQMAQAGMMITMAVLWFQFIMSQLIVASSLSTTISEEIRKKTIGILMVTPITGLQIVLGKLFSSLLQLIILLAISLPVLALVRLFGGIPADFIFSTFCMIVTAALFTGSISLYFSISLRKNRQVISGVIGILALGYLALPALLQALFFINNWPMTILSTVLMYINPFRAMGVHTSEMLMAALPGAFFSWPLHCAIMLAGTLIMVILAARKVRKVVLYEGGGFSMMYRLGRLVGVCLPAQACSKIATSNSGNRTAKIRTIKGSPIAWKEANAPQISRNTIKNKIGSIILSLAIVGSYIYLFLKGWLYTTETQIVYVVVYTIGGVVSMAVTAAGAITSEKEARTWPILLTIPAENFRIILAKGLGVLYRNLPIWLLLLAHVIIFAFFGVIHFAAIIHIVLIILLSIVIYIPMGLFCSVITKKTSTAVSLTLTTAFILGFSLPGLASSGSLDQAVARLFFSTNPVCQTFVVMETAAGKREAQKSLTRLKYDWPRGDAKFNSTTLTMLLCLLISGFSWFIPLPIVAKSLRTKVFEHT